MPRRKPNVLLPLELAILAAGMDLLRSGAQEFHGYLLATYLRDVQDARRLTAHGTLYRGLGRLESGGFLSSRLEDPDLAARENRPRRRLYTLTAEGQRAAATAPARAPGSQPAAPTRRRGMAAE